MFDPAHLAALALLSLPLVPHPAPADSPAPTDPAAFVRARALAQDGGRIARSGPAAELDLLRHLVRDSRPEDALARADALLEASPEGADGGPLGRERARISELIDLRDRFLGELAASTGRLRVPIDGKHRNLKVEAYEDGVLSFVQNKYELEFLTVEELDLADLAKAWKSADAEPLEALAYGLALVGDRSWTRLWGRDAEPPVQLQSDLAEVEASAARGRRVEALRELEAFLGQRLDAKAGRRIVALHETIFGGGPVELEGDDDGGRLRILRDLVTAGLEAGFGAADLPRVLHPAASEMRGEELYLRYDFTEEVQAEDWLRDETRLALVRQIGLLQTPEDQHRMGIVGGALEALGTQGMRFTVPFKGPIRVRYGMQLPEVGVPDRLWQMLVFLNDDLDQNYFAVHGFGYWIELLDLNFPKQVKREQQYYEVGTDYFTELVVDERSDLTARREDLADEHILSMPSRKVNKGYVSLVSHSDYVTRISSVEIQGKPDLDQLPLHRQAWVWLRLSELGF